MTTQSEKGTQCCSLLSLTPA
uniref:Uncharacterized protein n=1 Tax=Anguilla anguilla TaxID=7936 RepID=A0A0E9V846_ANGAN